MSCSLNAEHLIKFIILDWLVYVLAARQIGFEDASEVPKLCLLAQEYLQKFKGCDQSIYEYLANEKDSESLYVKLVDEFERCILSYFAFHWKQAPIVISQVHSPFIFILFFLYINIFLYY
jgi:hypothetical protein